MSAKVVAAMTLALSISAAAVSPARANETVFVCDVYGDSVAPPPAEVVGIAATTHCPGNYDPGYYTARNPPGGLAIWTRSNHRIAHGTSVRWTVKPPAGMTISSVYIPHMYSSGLNDGAGWGGGFFWQGGSGGVSTTDGESGWSSAYTGTPKFSWPSGGTPYFGWRVFCTHSPCTNNGTEWLSVELLELGIKETVQPTLSAPDGLWTASGWVRGTWPLHYSGDSPSGVCALLAALDGTTLPSSSSKRDPSLWHQCSAPAVDAPVDTASYGQGAATLALGATDAAGNKSGATKTIEIDNQTPTISVAGPTDAPTTAGTQYLTATAAAGPSGVAGILCSIDNAPGQWHTGASAQVAVQGLGVHHIVCASANNAHDGAGHPGFSSPASWTLNIREPSVSTVAFARLAARLKCRHTRERVRIPARWVKGYHHHRAVRIRLPAQMRTVRLVRCHPHLVKRRVLVRGRWVTEPIVKLPHAAFITTRRLRPGHSARVGGWLGTASGKALAGQPVTVLAAPADGRNRYARIASVRTGPDGTWHAKLGPGPSRIVMAAYRGDDTAEPSVSAPARVVVPASIVLHVSPRSAHWGGRIVISGRLKGGHIPSGGELVVLWVGWHGGATEIGHVYTRADGSFATSYTFLRGNGTETYRLWAESARESDYPFAPGHSRGVRVTVSP